MQEKQGNKMCKVAGRNSGKSKGYRALDKRQVNKKLKAERIKKHLKAAKDRREKNHSGFTARELRRHPEYSR